jgi:Gas vesicle protein G
MGILSELLLLPLLPVRGAFWAIGQVADAAEREFYGPAVIRRQLMELSRELDAGTITAEEFDRLEDQLLDRLAIGTELRP